MCRFQAYLRQQAFHVRGYEYFMDISTANASLLGIKASVIELHYWWRMDEGCSTGKLHTTPHFVSLDTLSESKVQSDSLVSTLRRSEGAGRGLQTVKNGTLLVNLISDNCEALISTILP